MSDSLNRSERYRALAEQYRRLAATSSSIEKRERYLQMARIAASWRSPKNQEHQPTAISRQAMATENADNARPATISPETSRFPKPWQIVEIPNGFAVDDATGRQLGVFYGRTDPNTAGHTDFVMIDEALQIAVDFARLPELLKQTSDQSNVATSPEDDQRAKLEINHSMQNVLEARGLHRGAQFRAATRLPSVEMPMTIPNSISFGRDGWKSTPLLRWPGDPLFNRAKSLIAIAVAALPAGYFIFASSDRPVDIAVAPQATANVPSVEFLPLRKADAPSANATDVTVESRAEPEVQKESLQSARPLDIKPTESGIEAKPPETFTERGRGSFAASQDASSCFHSASDVRQNSPGAWPSWTLRALGHEGTRCWYAATRFTARYHRSEMRRKETVQTTEKLEFPRMLFGSQ
jgi:hypothetical protein